MTIREGRWRCPRCNRENLGRDLECQGCGDTRDDDVAFYLPGEEPEVTDQELLDRARAGTDLLCEYCEASNPPDAEECEGCGAPLGERRRQEVYHPDQQPKQAVAPPPPKRGLGRGAKLGLFGCFGVFAVLLLTLVVGSLWHSDVVVTVENVSWERSLDVEHQVTVTRTGWEGELPSGARPVSRRRAVREQRQVQVGTTTATENESYRVQVGTEKVKVGTRDLGNGFFEDVYEDRPVYETRTRQKQVNRPVYEQQPVWAVEVTYRIDEWQAVRTARESGSDLSPRWPVVGGGERERPGSRKATYSVVLKGPKGQRFTYEPSASAFQRFAPGSKHTGQLDAFGNLDDVRPRR
jgi:hypothetical protein